MYSETRRLLGIEGIKHGSPKSGKSSLLSHLTSILIPLKGSRGNGVKRSCSVSTSSMLVSKIDHSNRPGAKTAASVKYNSQYARLNHVRAKLATLLPIGQGELVGKAETGALGSG